MLDALDDRALAELERALLLTLHQPDSPTARRLNELGFLARLLATTPRREGFRVSYVEREEYERRRPPEVPPSARLVERYGSWRAVCWHAHGLLPDGRWKGPSRPWPSGLLGEPGIRAYTREEVLASIRQCANALRRTPTLTDYQRWIRARRREARISGKTIRLSGHSAIYRHFPAASGGWNAALHAATARKDITPQERRPGQPSG